MKCSFFFQTFTSEAEGLIKSSVLTSGHQLPPPQLSKTDDFYLISLVDTVSIDSERQQSNIVWLRNLFLPISRTARKHGRPLALQWFKHVVIVTTQTKWQKKYLVKIREENKRSQRCTRQIFHVTELYIRESLHSLKCKIYECFTEAGLDVNSIEGYEACFDNATPTFDTIWSDIAERPKEGNNNLSYVINMEVFIFISCFITMHSK